MKPIAKAKTLHGVFLTMQGLGVLLLGMSGSGKSEVALNLISQGKAKLIADDAPQFYRKGNAIIGECPSLLKNFIEIRNIGILNLAKIFGKQVIARVHRLDLIIHLKRIQTPPRRLQPAKQYKLLGISLPKFILPYNSPHIAILIETVVRNHLLKLRGYDAQHVFIQKQKASL